MKILLDKGTTELVDEFLAQIKTTSIEVEVVDYTHPTTPQERWQELVMASEGCRLYSDTPQPSSPLYVAHLPKSIQEVGVAIADAQYILGALEFHKDFGVTYIGRVDVSPRNILLVDHKKADLRHDVVLNDDLKDFLTASPEDWWTSLGVVSSANVDRLEEFLTNHIDSVPIAYTTGAMSKLKFFGLDYVHVNVPNASKEYGIQVRERTNRLFNEPVKQ